MDWYVPNDTAAVTQLRAEFTAFIVRHSAPDSDLHGAELIFSELLANAVENSTQPVWVAINWGAERPVLSVNDLGPGFELPADLSMPDISAARGRGLAIVTHLTDHLRVAAKAAGGSRVTATLPIRRPASANYEPPPMVVDQLLPKPEEANDGAFGKESFLRALTVQLAQLVELDAGPATAERLVAEVGGRVGYRMEEAFRHRKQLDDGPLDVGELAELLVGLKSGIDGDFFVIEATEEKIVLGNRRCPFGEAVKHSPNLCRTTSSVFGGIAARNRDQASVHLEERIAVGDPQCRVTVWLGPAPPEIAAEVHFYGRADARP